MRQDHDGGIGQGGETEHGHPGRIGVASRVVRQYRPIPGGVESQIDIALGNEIQGVGRALIGVFTIVVIGRIDQFRANVDLIPFWISAADSILPAKRAVTGIHCVGKIRESQKGHMIRSLSGQADTDIIHKQVIVSTRCNRFSIESNILDAGVGVNRNYNVFTCIGNFVINIV